MEAEADRRNVNTVSSAPLRISEGETDRNRPTPDIFMQLPTGWFVGVGDVLPSASR